MNATFAFRGLASLKWQSQMDDNAECLAWRSCKCHEIAESGQCEEWGSCKHCLGTREHSMGSRRDECVQEEFCTWNDESYLDTDRINEDLCIRCDTHAFDLGKLNNPFGDIHSAYASYFRAFFISLVKVSKLAYTKILVDGILFRWARLDDFKYVV